MATCNTRLALRRPCGALVTRPARRQMVQPLFSSQPSKEEQLQELEQMRMGLRRQLEQTARSTARDVAASSSSGAAAPASAPAAPAADGAPRKPLPEVDQTTFYPALTDAGSTLVLVDCFTDWCGPCKMILPTLEQWHAEMEGKVVMVKFNCNKANKDLGISLGIKVAPTFILYKEMKEVARMTGAKAEQLKALIEAYV